MQSLLMILVVLFPALCAALCAFMPALRADKARDGFVLASLIVTFALVIALCFVAEIAGLTPPIGMNVFATANALRINPSDIFKGVVPYFICEILLVLLIGLFPQIVTFLPTLFGQAVT